MSNVTTRPGRASSSAKDAAASREVASRLAVVTGNLNRRIRSAGGGLSHGMLSALATVSKIGPIRPADLAHHELVSAPSMTRVVSELEARELVTRTVDPDDGRAVLISVTAHGMDAVVRARAARADLVGELLFALDEGQVAAIAAALPALEAALARA
jgi:DNA-binding MarR family transcriptional regulator